MSLPAIRFLKENLPTAKIYISVQNYLSQLYLNINEITDIVSLPSKNEKGLFLKAANCLRQYNFSYGILFTNSFRSALLFKLAGIKNITGYKKDGRSFLLKNSVKFPTNNKHHIHFYLDLTKHFLKNLSKREYQQPIDFTISSNKNELAISTNEKKEVTSLLTNLGVDFSKPFIGISSSSAYGNAKDWPPNKFKELVLRFQNDKYLSESEILFFGSEKEKDKISEILSGFSSKKVFNLAGCLTLRASATAISLCTFFISNDSGLMHIASSFDIPLIALFGPTLPHKTGPQNSNTKILYHLQKCAPCLSRTCPLAINNHICMKSITVDEVLNSVFELWPHKSKNNE